jgi:cell division cycle protein 37
MVAGGQSAQVIFQKDVDDTYGHVVNRVKISKQEEMEYVSAGEQIQLVAENPDTVISFNVPDGPPPEQLVLEGPGTEGMEIEQVRNALQMRWDLFCGLSPELQEALKTNELAAVNKVLGNMAVGEAENAVKALDMGGILNFAEEGIRDETGRANQVDEAEGGDNDKLQA